MRYTGGIVALIAWGLLPGTVLADGCGATATPIARVQGAGSASPLTGQSVTVEGVMTLDGRGSGGLGGFYLQTAPGEDDGDAATSEGLFVYTRAGTGTVGQRLRVSGTIKEYYGLTELAARGSLTVCGEATVPDPVPLAFPLPARREALEAMRVAFDQPLVVTNTHDYARFGLVTLAADDAIKGVGEPPGLRDSLLLDDRSLAQNPVRLPLPVPGLSADHSLRAGSRLAPVQGILDFRYQHWHLQPEHWPAVVSANPRPAEPSSPASGSLRVASFNVLNYFNGDGQGGGFPTARGADSAAELERQRRKLVNAIRGLHADVIGLMEVENDGVGPDSALADLTSALGEDWAYVPATRAGNDAIRVALVYRADRVEPVGESTSLVDGEFARFSRAPLAQVFRIRGAAPSVRVVVNHFKSRSCRHARGENTDRGDGLGCYAPVRDHSARQLLAWLRGQPSVPGLAGTVILGDLNSYTGEPPLAALGAGGYAAPPVLADPQAYTYRFKGVRGVLDHILTDPAITRRVLGGGIWHINADEPTALDYNLEYHPPARAAALYSTGPWRASDHDPVYLDIRMR